MSLRHNFSSPSPARKPTIMPIQPSLEGAAELELPSPWLPLTATAVANQAPTGSLPTTDSEFSSNDSVFSSTYSSSESSHTSPLRGSQTPVKKTLDLKRKSPALSESVTPVNTPGLDHWQPLDPDQLALRLHLQAALQGKQTVPGWCGLAQALRAYFNSSWHQDSYTLKYCEENKEFLFWNAVADEKWRMLDRGY